MSVIAAILGKLFASKLGVAGAAALGGALAAKAGPLVRPLFGKLLKSKLDAAFAPNLSDPVESAKLRALAVAAFDYAEYKIPDRGQGAARKVLVVAALSRFLPGLAAQAVGDLVEEFFASLDDGLKQKLGKS